MNRFGRIVVSGQMADYNRPRAEVPGLRNTRAFITHRVRMEGLVVFDDIAGFPEARAVMADWLRAGRLHYREQVYDGLEQAPRAFIDLFERRHFGRRVIRVGAAS
jgi:NADPH-dependent curcumin reductase CurA